MNQLIKFLEQLVFVRRLRVKSIGLISIYVKIYRAYIRGHTSMSVKRRLLSNQT